MIYVASKTVHAPRWREWRAKGQPISSTWIDEAGVGETKSFVDLWLRCVREAATCHKLIAYREGDEVLKGAFIEIGSALGNGRPVIVVGNFHGFSFLSHPLVRWTSSLDEAFGVKL